MAVCCHLRYFTHPQSSEQQRANILPTFSSFSTLSQLLTKLENYSLS